MLPCVSLCIFHTKNFLSTPLLGNFKTSKELCTNTILIPYPQWFLKELQFSYTLDYLVYTGVVYTSYSLDTSVYSRCTIHWTTSIRPMYTLGASVNPVYALGDQCTVLVHASVSSVYFSVYCQCMSSIHWLHWTLVWVFSSTCQG